jgi:hypothetical protein
MFAFHSVSNMSQSLKFMLKKIKLFLSFLLAVIMFLYTIVYIFSSNDFDRSSSLSRTNYGSLLSTCHDSSNIDFYQIANLHQSEVPAAYLISTGNDVFSKGTICVGVVVFIPSAYEKSLSQGLAIDNYPPDAIYLDIIGKDFQVVPKTESEFVQIQVSEHGLARYYKLNIDFRDADDYYVSGYLECILFRLIYRY